MFVCRSNASSRFSERRHQSFDAKRSNKLRCGRFGRFAALQQQQQQQQHAQHHQSQNIAPPAERSTTQLDCSNGQSIAEDNNNMR